MTAAPASRREAAQEDTVYNVYFVFPWSAHVAGGVSAAAPGPVRICKNISSPVGLWVARIIMVGCGGSDGAKGGGLDFVERQVEVHSAAA